MKFKRMHCVPTSLLTQETYSELICKLVSEGYRNQSPHIQVVSLIRCWDYLGVNSYGDIFPYNDNRHYASIDYEGFDNVLTEQWLEEYLK